MSDETKAPCIFCNETVARLSDEHVLPHHWKKSFPSGTGGNTHVSTDRYGWVDEKEQKQITPYDMRVRRVCVRCNSGWMREMDEAIKELIFELAWGTTESVGTAEGLIDTLPVRI